MKIALVSPYDYPYPGGVTEHIVHLESQFTSRGHHVSILAPSSTKERDATPENVYKIGSVVSVPANGSMARISLSLRLSGKVKRILEEQSFDVVHLHEPLAPALPLTVLWHSQAVNIGTFHRYGGTDLMYYYGRPILRRWFNRLDGRIAVSEPARRFVSRNFKAKYIIIPNGIDIGAYGSHLKPFPEFTDDKLNILFVGRLEKRKGYSYLLRAFLRAKEQFPNIRLIAVGPFNDSAKLRFEMFAKSHSLFDTHLVGFVSKEDLARYYRTCDIFCAPSTGGESFGIILLEAMASGKPIVASDIDGYRQVIEHGKEGLLVPPKDDKALAEALLTLLKDAQMRKRMGATGLATVQQYSWDSIATRILDYYRAVLHACGRPVVE